MIKKVMVVRNLPSNIFDEVSFTIKEGVNIDAHNENETFRSDSILIEAEGIIQDYINKYEMCEEKKENLFDKIIHIIKKV